MQKHMLPQQQANDDILRVARWLLRWLDNYQKCQTNVCCCHALKLLKNHTLYAGYIDSKCDYNIHTQADGQVAILQKHHGAKKNWCKKNCMSNK